MQTTRCLAWIEALGGRERERERQRRGISPCLHPFRKKDREEMAGCALAQGTGAALPSTPAERESDRVKAATAFRPIRPRVSGGDSSLRPRGSL